MLCFLFCVILFEDFENNVLFDFNFTFLFSVWLPTFSTIWISVWKIRSILNLTKHNGFMTLRIRLARPALIVLRTILKCLASLQCSKTLMLKTISFIVSFIPSQKKTG